MRRPYGAGRLLCRPTRALGKEVALYGVRPKDVAAGGSHCLAPGGVESLSSAWLTVASGLSRTGARRLDATAPDLAVKAAASIAATLRRRGACAASQMLRPCDGSLREGERA